MKSLKKKCFSLFQQIGLERNPFCQRPGCGCPAAAVHHVFPRRNLGTAFEPDNGLSLCNEDHDGWARKHPQEVHQLLTAILGYEHYTHLEYLSNQVVRLREADFKNIAVELQKKLEGMRGKV